MIIFWIFTFFVGSSPFAFVYIYLLFGLPWSVVYAVIAAFVCRELLTTLKRLLVFSQPVAQEANDHGQAHRPRSQPLEKRVGSLLGCLLKIGAVASLLYGLALADSLLTDRQYIAAMLEALISSMISLTLFGVHYWLRRIENESG